MTALQSTKVSHCEYADDITLTTNTAHHLQLQLDQFHTYTALKGLTLNVHKTKTMAVFCSNPPIFCYSGTQLENVHEFKYLGTTLSHTGKTTNASNQMARNFAGAIARVSRICSELGSKNGKHAMLWIFHSLPAFMDVKFWLQRLSHANHLLQLKPTSTTFPF